MEGKQQFLKMVKANGCRRKKITSCYKIKPILETKGNPKNQKGKNQKEDTKSSKKENKPKMTKFERKLKYK